MASPAPPHATKATRPITFEALADLVAGADPSRRIVVAIAGAPGSGKSTLAERLVERLNAAEAGSAALLPMDGYHYDDRVLIERGLRARKGAPETFDVFGLAHMLDRLKRNEEAEIAVPVFDRDLEIARAGARIIPRRARILVVEGNYLMLAEAPWSRLRPTFDISVSVEASEETLRQRLTERWRGYNLPPAEIEAKVEGNDLPNARYVMAMSAPADFAVSS
jgi:pantothenate kinase